MKLIFIACLLLACSAAQSDYGTFVVIDDFFQNDYVIYTGQHDIVKIYIPFNKFNFQTDFPYTVFFVEADVSNGQQQDKGIYVYKNRTAVKVLENGRDAVATAENIIYIAAKDGIYKFNDADNSAAKHGNVNDNSIQLAHNNVTNTVYYLTADHEVFKLNHEATNSDKVGALKDVQAFVFGYEGNMYYFDSKKNLYIYNDAPNAVPRKVAALPSNVNKLTLVDPMNGMEEGSILLIDKSVYIVKPDGRIVEGIRPDIHVRFDVDLTAFGPQPTLLQFYAKNKKLYGFDIPAIVKNQRQNFCNQASGQLLRLLDCANP